MGWASGSEIMSEIIDETKSAIKDKKKRKAFYMELINIFENHDCDTLCDCLEEDEVFDDAMKAMHPDWEYFNDEPVENWN